MGILATSVTNNSIIRPVGFYIVGFTSLKFSDLYIIFLAIIYIATLVFNSIILFIILTDHRLHTPKYLAVSNLAITDLIFSSAFIPGMIKVFLVKDNFISFNECLTQMFFYLSFLILESCSLSLLGYDRLIAICFPLRQSSNTIIAMIIILVTAWSFCVSVGLCLVAIVTRLSFCNSVIVECHFCDYGHVIKLACSNILHWYIASYSSLFFIIVFGNFSLTGLSYVCILTTVFRMKSVESRSKALVTCAEHVVLVAIFYGPFLAVIIAELILYRKERDAINLSLSLASAIPPCVNPMVYSLATKEIRNRIRAMFRKDKLVAWMGLR